MPMWHEIPLELGAGEAEAIALSLELGDARLILDDRVARRRARALGVPVMGSAGVLLAAKERGVPTAVRPLLDELRAAGLHLAKATHAAVLELAAE
ncbi:MAG: DUF3368 domain-containing protein [Chloroflexota bacterium]|nr:MAG: DUF3368 domain-containing protein [Chloroflexota bacterium]